MAITKANLRTRVRDKIRDWYLNQDAINMAAGINSAATYVVLDDATKFRANDFVDIDDETLKVTAVSSNSATIQRAQRGSTAAAHTDNTLVTAIDEWTKREIDDAIESAFEQFHPDLYVEYVSNFKGQANRRTIDACNSATFTQSADASAPVLDTTNQKVGSGCLDLATTYSAGYGTYERTLASTFDGSGYDYLNMWFYVKDLINSSDDPIFDDNALELRVGNHSAAYKYLAIGKDELSAGNWNLIVGNLQDFASSGTVDMTALDYFMLKINAKENLAAGDIKMDEWFMTTYPTTTYKLDYRLPSNVYRVNRLFLYENENSNRYAEVTNWNVNNGVLSLNEEVLLKSQVGTLFDVSSGSSANYPMKIVGNKRLAVPTADTTTIDLDEPKSEIIVLQAAVTLFDSMFASRARFDQYSAKLNAQDQSILSIQRLSNAYRDRVQELLQRYAQSPGASVIDWDDNY